MKDDGTEAHVAEAGIEDVALDLLDLLGSEPRRALLGTGGMVVELGSEDGDVAKLGGGWATVQ